MAIECDPKSLAEAAKCYCFNEPASRAAMLYLLNQISGLNLTPKQLAENSKCFCMNERESNAAITYLLCQNAGGGTGSCAALSGSGDPTGTTTPQFIGQLYHDTTADTYYRSTGLTAADWVAISGGGGACDLVLGPDPTVCNTFFGPECTDANLTYTLPSLVTNNGLTDFSFDAQVTRISMPAFVTNVGDFSVNGLLLLTTLDLPLLRVVGGKFKAANCPSLSTLNIPSLVSVGSSFEIDSCPALTIPLPNLTTVTGGFSAPSISATVLNLPSLVTVGGTFDVSSSGLITLVVPNWIPTNGTSMFFNPAALSATSVELILRRCVLAGVTTCVIDLSGGTNAGLASLNAQGQADAATLGAQLTINP